MRRRPLRSFVRGGALGLLVAATVAWPGRGLEAAETLDRVEAPIINGSPDALHKGVVSLLKRVEGGFYPACTGTLLTQNLVLTAHHCVAPLTSGDASSVECGETEFEAKASPRDVLVSVEQSVGEDGLAPFRVAEVWVPPGDNAVCGRDVALLLLSGAGVPANLATPIAPRLETKLKEDDPFVAIGYGLQDPEDRSGRTAGTRMLSTDAQVYCDGAECGTPLVGETEFIASSPVCSGDSGGPAIDENGLVSGVTSRGDPECTVGIYGSVAAWKDFILEKTFLAAKSGNYVPPAWAGAPPPGYEPAVDPIGLSCTGACPLGYQCWSESGTAPGICVPPCGLGYAECPTSYTCEERVSACVPAPPPADDSSGCSVAAPGGTLGSGLLGLVLLALRTVRRRPHR